MLLFCIKQLKQYCSLVASGILSDFRLDLWLEKDMIHVMMGLKHGRCYEEVLKFYASLALKKKNFYIPWLNRCNI